MEKQIFVRLRPVLIAALLFVSACAPRPREITILAVNDIHGMIDNFPKLATLVGQYRAADSTNFLFVDAGDRWTGNPFVDMNERRGWPIIDLLNQLGLQLATLGNHEFDFGLDILSDRVRESEFKYVCANFDSNGSPLPQPAPYHIFDINGTKVCILGLITTARAGYPDGFVKNFGTINFSNPINTALKYRHLRDSCHVLAALTHIGYELDSVLAVQMPELDLIIGGHSHTVVPNNKIVQNTNITQAGSRLQYANVITLSMSGRKLEHISSKLVALDTVASDPYFVKKVEEYKNFPALNAVMGSLSVNLNKTGVMNLIADLTRKASGADIAIYNWGGIRVDSLAKGKISLSDIYSIEPFSNMIEIVEMTPEQIKEIILNKFNSMGKESHREDLYPSGFSYRIVTDTKGKESHRQDLYPSGFSYHLMTDAKGEGIDVLLNINAKPSPSGTYKVAMSDYVASAYNFSAAGTGEPTGLMVTDIIIDHFKNNSPVTGSNEPRISIDK